MDVIRYDFERFLNEKIAKDTGAATGLSNSSHNKYLSESNSVDSFNEFMSRIPGGQPTAEVIKVIDSFNDKDFKEFVNLMGTLSNVSDASKYYSAAVSGSGIHGKIFAIKPSGIGPGEAWLAWLVKDARVSGGGESFDLTVGKKQYEVKSYHDSNSPFRLGNAGAASKLEWVHKMVYLADIAGLIAGNKKASETMPKVYAAATNLNSASKSPKGDFARGEISATLFKAAQDFIDAAHEHIKTVQTGYEIVTFQSSQPGNPNISYLIEPVSGKDTEKSSFKIIAPLNLQDIDNEISMNRMLVKHSYVRDGRDSLLADVNKGLQNVNAKYAGMQFIVFRKKGINISNNIKLVPDNDVAKYYGSGLDALFQVSGALLRVRENV